jgi:hypothetical protein
MEKYGYFHIGYAVLGRDTLIQLFALAAEALDRHAPASNSFSPFTYYLYFSGFRGFRGHIFNAGNAACR